MALRSRLLLSFLALVALLHGAAAHAQTMEGTIRGVVTDSTGAGAPGASLTITNQATGAARVVTSVSDGSYSASVAPGLYSLVVALKGFGKQTRKDLKLESGATLTASFALAAQLSEGITVTSLKRESTLQEVPFAVAAPTEAELQKRGVDDIEGHVGSRFTLVQDQEPGFGTIAVGFGGIGKPYTQATFQFDPELPAYDLVNLRLGVLKGDWDVALFGNNLTDERALFALDREAGKNARLGYLTNQPRTFGLTARVKF